MKTKKEVFNNIDNKWEMIEIEPCIGQCVTVYLWSDSEVYDIIGISKSTKKLTLRKRREILVEKPEMVVGGFAGVVTKKAVWKTETNLNGHVTTANWSEKEKIYKVNGRNRVILDKDSYYYDYSF